MRSSNPAFNASAFQMYDHAGGYTAPRATTMTVAGTVSKTFLLLAILSATAIWSWTRAEDYIGAKGVVDGNGLAPLLGGGAIGGLVVALITIFRPQSSPWTAPVYAALEGIFLGALSRLIESMFYPGIAIQAVGLTGGTLAVMLALYGTRTVRVTDKLRTGIIAATGALALVYLITMVLHLFHVPVPFIHSGGKVGIIFSLFVVGLAAFNLLLDFDMIERGAASAAPKWMEWYGGFGLMVTLVWLYLEILRLLQKVYADRR